jgi:NAD(P)-dependent dehydrogenase (short-subunit alcohol dehydrogenase family)
MIAQQHGLIAFTSSSGSVHYCLGPAYGAHKAGMDKFAADMAVDFRATGVNTISIWMGSLKTERLMQMIADDPKRYGFLEAVLETPHLTGHVIWALYNDPKLQEISGQTVIGAEMAVKYGILDEGGRQPPSTRKTHGSPREPGSMIVR